MVERTVVAGEREKVNQMDADGTVGSASPLAPRPSFLPAFHVMAKPTGASLAWNCAYCFFLKKEALYPAAASACRTR